MYTVTSAKEAVKIAIRGYLYKDEKGKYRVEERNCLPIYLEGAPGIGKTEIVSQISEELGIGFVSFSLVHHTRNSLLGLPVIRDLENGDKYTSYTMSEIIAKVLEQETDEGILLLDEFPCMSETIMPAMLAFLQTKNIGLHTLPRGWVVVLCGNPTKYNKSAKRFDSAILDRIRKIEMEYDIACFVEYGRKKGLEKNILDYLEVHPTHIYRYEEKGQEMELVTCRAWENLSHAYTLYKELEQEIDIEFIKQFIKSEEIANSFMCYEKQCRVGLSFMEMDEILEGKGFKKYQEKIEGLSYNQQWMLAGYLCERLTTKQTKEEIGMGRYREIADWIDNVLDMLESVDDKGILNERVYFFINKSVELLKVVTNVRVPSYLKMCDKYMDAVGM